MEVASFEQVFGKAIPQSSKLEIVKGFKTYKKYCIECHRVNFAGGAKGTEHVVRPVPISEKTLLFYAFEYRKNNPLSYMPDFSDILTTEQVGNIFTYLNHMHNHQNICIMEPNYGPCQEVTSGNG